jgi:hypothetical protein
VTAQPHTRWALGVAKLRRRGTQKKFDQSA